MARNLTFNLEGNDKQLLSVLQRAQKELKETGTVAETTGTRAKSMGLGLKGFVAGLGLVAAGKEALDQANESQVVQRQTAAAIKSTGNAAGISAKQQDQLAQSLSKVAAVDDEVISGAENMLRRFTNIKGAIFDRGIADALDLAAGKGIELSAAVQTLGKAIDDPVKGMTRLTRVGITLNDQQKEQITTMEKSGDVAGAQGVILDALEKRYKGSAEAAATGSMRARVALGNLAETAGTIAEPAIDAFGHVLEGVSTTLESLPRPAQTGILALAGIGLAAHKLNDTLGDRGGLKGLLTADVSELGKMDTALAGAVVGVGSYASALQFLNNTYATTHVNSVDLADDLSGLGDKSSKTSDVFAQFGGSAEALAREIRAVNKDSIGSRLADLIEIRPDKIIGVRSATADISALDDQLATLARTNPQAARKAVAELEGELHKQGITADVLLSVLSNYNDELGRTKTQHLDAKQAAEGHGDEEKLLGDRFYYTLAAMQAVDEQTKKLTDDSLSAFDAQRAYESAVSRVTEAEDKLKFLRAGKAKAADIAAAERDLTDAIAGQVEAKDRQIDAQDKVNGTTTTATGRALILRDELGRLQTQTGTTSADLDILAANLDKAAKHRKVVLDTKEAEAAVARLNTAILHNALTGAAGATGPGVSLGVSSSAVVATTTSTGDSDVGPHRSLVHIEHLHATDVAGAVNAIERAGRRAARHARAGV